MKKISILGSTGSIGSSTLKVVNYHQEKIEVVALAAHSDIEKLQEQIVQFCPEVVGVYDEAKAIELQKLCPDTEVIGGIEGLIAAATCPSSDMVISAIAGTAGLIPTIEAIKARKRIGLANKEALVSGGEVVMNLVKEYGVELIPIDSEHSAIFQCLNGENRSAVDRIILTASGGPFRSYSDQQLKEVTVDQALNHPNWSMGPKVTIDSSTLMNKGLEMIEAYWLFGLEENQITTVVHPQSIVHSMVEFVDRSVIAQMGEPKMVTPIQYAISYPDRLEGTLERFDFLMSPKLEFFDPDTSRFRCLKLAQDAIDLGKSMPCYMNGVNEVLVQKFLNKKIGWNQIGEMLDLLMSRHDLQPIKTYDDVLAVDKIAREEASKI